MPPKSNPRHEASPAKSSTQSPLLANVVGVIAGFLPLRIDDLRPLMLVNTTWYRGVIEQDGMKSKPGVYWPWCVLEERKPSSVSLAAVDKSIIRDICDALPQLQELIVDGPVKEPAALEQLSRLPQLTSLHFLHCYNRTAAAIIKRVVELPQLRTLVFKNVEMKNTDLRSIAQNLPELESLSVDMDAQNDSNNVTNAGLKHIGDNLEKLRELRIRNALAVTDCGLEYLADCEELTSLDLDLCYRITDEGMQHLKNFKKLEEFCLHQSEITDASLQHLSDLVQIKKLDISGCRELGGGANLAQLSQLKKMEALDLRACSLATNDGLQYISTNFLNLKTLDIALSKITDEGLVHLKGMEQLRTLTIGGQNCPITDTGVATIANNCLELTCLNMRNMTTITDDALQPIGQRLKKLKELDLERCPVTDVGMAFLADGLCDLEILSVGCRRYGTGGNITDVGVGHIARLPKLAKLFLSQPDNIGDAGIKQLKNLRELKLGSSSDDNGSDGITDDGIKHLVQNNPQLTYLDYCNATDCSLQYIAEHLHNLTTFFFTHHNVGLSASPKVTEAGMQAVINSMSQLQRLYINIWTLKDAAFKNIGHKLKNLTYLGVSACGCSEVSMKEFADLDKLNRLRPDIRGLNFSGDDAILRSNAFKKWERSTWRW